MPSRSSPRNTIVSVAWAFMIIPLVPLTSTPASNPSEEIVIDLVIVTAPNPPGSRTLISPAGAVFEIAPANVLQDAVLLHGFASSPTPDTQVLGAWALQTTDKVRTENTLVISLSTKRCLFTTIL